MSDGSPGRSGTTRGATFPRGASAGPALSVRSVRRLFCATDVVYADSSASDGTEMTLTDPRYECTYRPLMPDTPPIPDPTPNNEPTASDRPSALTSRLVGYQLVGMRPRSVPPGSR